MIKSVKLINFLSFGEETVDLNNDLNLLVGMNGSGKTNFIKAVRLLKEGVSGIGLKKYVNDVLGGFDNFCYKGDPERRLPNTVTLQFILDCETIKNYGFKFFDDIHYTISLVKYQGMNTYFVKEKIQNEQGYLYLDFDNGEGVLNEKTSPYSNKTSLVRYSDFTDTTELALSKIYDSNRYFALSTIRKALNELAVYDYFDMTVRSGFRRPPMPSADKKLLFDGSNLPQILNTIKINHKSDYSQITQMLVEVNKYFKGFDFNLVGGNIELMVEEEHLISSVPVANMSDSMMKYLYLLTVIFNPDRGKLICIDEPENGLNPIMVKSISEAIKSASAMTTFVVATNSVDFAKNFNQEKIKFFKKTELNTSTSAIITENEYQEWSNAYNDIH